LKVVFVEDLLKLFVVDVDVFVDAEEVKNVWVLCFGFLGKVDRLKTLTG
jgi:hypothetical protein